MSRDIARGIRHRTLTRRQLAAISAGGGAALALAGCGGGNNNSGGKAATSTGANAAPRSTSSATAATGATGSSATAVAAAPRKKPTNLSEVPWSTDLATNASPKSGGTYPLIQSTSWPSIDPLKNAAADPAFFHGLHSSTLVASDASPGITLFQDPIVPDIAAKWEQPDSTTYVFHIDPKAKWNDKPPANGRAVNADDVKYSFQRWASGGPTGPRFAVIDQLTSVDQATIRITTKGPAPEFLFTVGFEYHPIVNKEYVESIGNDLGEGSTAYIGTGPFMLSDFTARQKATWVKNPTYFGTDKAGKQLPYLDKINWAWIIDASARQAAYDAGQVDNTGISANLFSKYNNGNDTLVTKSVTSAANNILGFNLRKAPGNDPRVRKALSLVLDRKAISDGAYAGLATPPSPLPPKATGKADLPLWNELPANYKRDLTAAKQLLQAAGFGSGLNIGTLWYYDVGSVEWINAVLLYQQQLKEAGITATPQVVDRSKQLDDYFGGKWDGLQMEYSTNPGVSNQSWADWMHSKAQNNYWGINDPQVDSLVEQLRTTIDDNQRIKLFTSLLQLEYDNVYRPFGFIPANLNVFRSNLVNPSGLTSSYLAYKTYALKYTARG